MSSPYQPMSQQEVQMELKKVNPNLSENKIILLTVLNAVYPVNVELVHKICKPISEPVRIVIFQKYFLQVLVEFESIETATKAKSELHSCDIYPGSCTIKAEFAKADKLNVKRNDSMTWDFTVNQTFKAEEELGGDTHRKVLISQPPPVETSRTAMFDNPLTPKSSGMGSTGLGNSGGAGFGSSVNQTYMNYMQSMNNSGGARGNNFDWGGGYQGGGSESGGNYSENGSGYHGGSSSSFRGGSGYQGRSSSGYQSGVGGGEFSSGTVSVVMLYGLDDKFNCMGVFNLFCLYGNVLKVSFMRNKPGCAIVEMSDPTSVDRVLNNLNGAIIFGTKISIERSRKPYVEEIRKPHELYDGSPSYVNFSGSNNHRFDSEEKAMKNRIVSPTNVLHFYNVPQMSDDELTAIFSKVGGPCPHSIKWFDAKASARTMTGLLKFDDEMEACEALVLANHAPAVKPGHGSIHDMKLCFSKTRGS